MPKAVHDLAIKLQSKGKSEDSAWAIANSQLSKTTKNDKNVGESMDKYGEIADQSPPMTLVPVQKQNTGTWPTSMNPSFANTMGQMREDGMPMGGQQMPGQQMPGMPCDICGGPEHPPMDHPYLPRMPNDPMAMTQQQMPMAPLPMQAPPPMPQMQQPPQQPPMQPHPAQTQAPGHEEGGLGSGEYPHGSGGGAMQAPSGGGQSGGGDSGQGGQGGGGGDSGFGGSMGGGKAPPGPIMSFETVKMNEAIMKQVIDRKVGCGCQKSKKG